MIYLLGLSFIDNILLSIFRDQVLHRSVETAPIATVQPQNTSTTKFGHTQSLRAAGVTLFGFAQSHQLAGLLMLLPATPVNGSKN